MHPTCTTDGRCDEPFDYTVNEFNIRRSITGEIHVTYSVLCSHWSCTYGPDGLISFRPNDQGGYDSQGVVEKFPNLEAYYYKKGKLHSTIFQIQHFSAEERASGTAHWLTARHMTGFFDKTMWWYPGTYIDRSGLGYPLPTIEPINHCNYPSPNSAY